MEELEIGPVAWECFSPLNLQTMPMAKHVKTKTTADRAIMATILELILWWLLLCIFALEGSSLLLTGPKDPGIGTKEGRPAICVWLDKEKNKD